MMTGANEKQCITQLLNAVNVGDVAAADQLFSLLYDELRKMAGSEMRSEAQGITLQPTALVHEVWIKLLSQNEPLNWKSRKHFFVTAARAMRRILVDAARNRLRLKRGGGKRRLPLQILMRALEFRTIRWSSWMMRWSSSRKSRQKKVHSLSCAFSAG